MLRWRDAWIGIVDLLESLETAGSWSVEIESDASSQKATFHIQLTLRAVTQFI